MPEVNLWNKALDILSRREHSISQLKSKIQKFQDNEEQVEELINKLIDKNLLSDKRFAESLIKSKSEAGYGPNYIEQLLQKNSISKNDYDLYSPNIDWHVICKNVAEKKIGNKKLNYEDKQKILRFLSYRGFTYEIIIGSTNLDI
ncbi:MAG: regulatory protein RecX [Gammaproteobacteria bacterium]